LKEKWWVTNPNIKISCQDEDLNVGGISIKNIGGVFIVIFGGIVLAIVTLLIEYCLHKVNIGRKTDFRRMVGISEKKKTNK